MPRADAIVGLLVDVTRYVHPMKIATFNIDNVVRRLPNLLDWLRASGPDVVCLQELKGPTRASWERG
jgi:endonuclease/exonuclease/phosphatase family metal-dependent hydrolase